MNMTHKYKFLVADFLFTIETTPEIIKACPNYAPFQCPETSDERPTTALRVSGEPIPATDEWTHVYTDKSDEDMPRIEMYRRDTDWLFLVSEYRDTPIVSALLCDEAMQHGVLYGVPSRFAVDNAMMLLFAFATAPHKTLLFHSAVIVYEGKGYMFLGHSGTGKSTHARQWLTAFPSAELLNDDNPVVRISEDGSARVYGSPWSGKTPCYKAADAPVQALVQLAQAPHNDIRLLKQTQAYPHILASVSGLKMNPTMMDRLYESIAALLASTPVYFLDCLPNPEAAQLCYSRSSH